MNRNVTTSLVLSFLVVCLSNCSSSENNIQSAEEIKHKTDSIELKRVALGYSEGKQLFSRYCNTCHVAPEKHVLDQYLFDNLFDRLPPPSEDYFVSYISDSKSLKASGKKYAKQVDEVWGQDYEHRFKDSLTARDLSNLITYIKIAANQRYQNKGG